MNRDEAAVVDRAVAAGVAAGSRMGVDRNRLEPVVTDKPANFDKRMKIIKTETAMAMTSFTDAFKNALMERNPDAQVATIVLCWPMVATGRKLPDGRPAYATEGDTLMVATLNPHEDPDHVLIQMLESALKQLKAGPGGGMVKFDPGTRH